MNKRKISAEEAFKQINDDAKRDVKATREAHEQTMEGFVVPLIEAGLVDDVEPTFTVHILATGLPLCGFSTGVPKNWPEGHKWVSITDPEDANCQKCLSFVEEAKQFRGRILDV